MTELVLRMFLLAGTASYILYYYYVSDPPLWEAIGASVLIGSANIPVVLKIFRERSTFGMSEEMLTLYKSFPNFNPGQFRLMMSKVEIIRDSPETILLEEVAVPGKLFLTISGDFVVLRGTQHAGIGAGNFLGEVAFLLGGAATANVVAKPGSSYVVWETDALQYMLDGAHPMANAVSVLLNKDVARKLAVSFPTRAKSIMPKNLI